MKPDGYYIMCCDGAVHWGRDGSHVHPENITELYSWNNFADAMELAAKFRDIGEKRRPHIYPAVWDSEGRPRYFDYNERLTITETTVNEGNGLTTTIKLKLEEP